MTSCAEQDKLDLEIYHDGKCCFVGFGKERHCILFIGKCDMERRHQVVRGVISFLIGQPLGSMI